MASTPMSALRTVFGTLVGYAVMVALTLATMAIAWRVLGGGSGAFAGEGPYPSTGWLAFAIGGGFLAAFVGGQIARRVGGSSLTIKILAALILLLGIITAMNMASYYGGRPDIDKPVAEMTFQEAGQYARQPAWFNWIIPLVGAVGVLLAGRFEELRLANREAEAAASEPS